MVRSRFLEMILTQGRSISSAASLLNVSISTAQGWAAMAGYEPPRRPSKLRGDHLDRTLARLKLGEEIPRVASEAGVSEVSVRRLLRTTVGLHDKWERARREKARDQARSQWRSALQIESVVGPGAARTLALRTYSWLYRNDREWLLATNSDAKVPIGNHSKVDWDRRDQELSLACRRAALQLHETAPTSRVTLTAVFTLVPEIRTKLHRLDRLPLTTRVLRAIVKSGRE
jgi:transposase